VRKTYKELEDENKILRRLVNLKSRLLRMHVYKNDELIIETIAKIKYEEKKLEF